MPLPAELATYVAQHTNLPLAGVEQALELFDQGATLPFIARYRQSQTGGLSETDLRQVSNTAQQYQKVVERRLAIISALQEAEQLTAALQNQLHQATTLVQLEDIYLPYKKKRQTRADKARKAGLEPLASGMRYWQRKDENQLQRYICTEYPTKDEVVTGAMDIVAEECTQDIALRDFVRQKLAKRGLLVANLKKNTDDEGNLFADYYEFSRPLRFVPAHTFLAIMRGVKQNVLSAKIEAEADLLPQMLSICKVYPRLAWFNQLQAAVQDAYKRLLHPSIETELLKELKQKADTEAAEVFAANLRHLLLTSPLKAKAVLGIDPGWAHGCKCAVVDDKGNVLATTVVYPLPPRSQQQEAAKTLNELIEKHRVDLIALGDGQGSGEMADFVANLLLPKHNSLKYTIVSEAGVSVYSASEIAVSELPDLDITLRGAVGLARRVMFPLDEYLKVPPASLGVGMYQHDVETKLLTARLDDEAQAAVAQAGVELNAASPWLLARVPGIGPAMANKIIQHRQQNGFDNRKSLLNVPGLGPKTYQQAAGFLTVGKSANPLDCTIVHPESYQLAKRLANYCGYSITKQWQEFKKQLADLDTAKAASELQTSKAELEFIKKAIVEQGQTQLTTTPPVYTGARIDITQLVVGSTYRGRVKNAVAFGLFVDIGSTADGLVHVSKLAPGCNPASSYHPGQWLDVVIENIDIPRKRVALYLAKQ